MAKRQGIPADTGRPITPDRKKIPLSTERNDGKGSSAVHVGRVQTVLHHNGGGEPKTKPAGVPEGITFPDYSRKKWSSE